MSDEPIGARVECYSPRWQILMKYILPKRRGEYFSRGTDTERDRCFSNNQIGGFCVCSSSFFAHLNNSVAVAKQAAILKISSGGECPRLACTQPVNSVFRAL